MHLLLGDPQDVPCRAVRDALEARGHSTRITNPLVDPSRFSWWLDADRSATSLALEEQTPVPDEQIDSVLVFNAGWIDPLGWRPNDLAYVQAETQAALLGWLWSLDCPVVNRYPPSIWYRPQAPLLSWHRLLRGSGLPTPETLVTNIEQEARSFGHRLAADDADGVVYGPLTSEARYLITSEEEWRGLVALQRVAPVSLSAPHGETQMVCVVGDAVVWDSERPRDMSRLEPALRRFAAAAGLAVVELALAQTSKGICVVAVQTHPRLERFGDAARAEIVDAIVQLLTMQAEGGRGR